MAEQCLWGPGQRERIEVENKGDKASLTCPDDACDKAVPLSPLTCVLPEQVCEIPAHSNLWASPTSVIAQIWCLLNTLKLTQLEMIS